MKNINAVARLADYIGVSLEALLLGKVEEPKRVIISSVTFEEDDRTYRISIERLK